MAYGRFVQEYQKGAVNGASPVGLIVMLYDGAIGFMEQGKHAMLEKDYSKQNHYLQKTQKIVMELMSCLDMKVGGEISTNLLALYTFILNELIDANVHDKTENIDRCIKIMSDLRESWVAIDAQIKSGELQVPIAA